MIKGQMGQPAACMIESNGFLWPLARQNGQAIMDRIATSSGQALFHIRRGKHCGKALQNVSIATISKGRICAAEKSLS
jgi:hypothetical protein